MEKLTDEMLAEASFDLYCTVWADEYETHGNTFKSGTVINDIAPRPSDEELLPPMREFVKRLEAEWKRPVAEVFALMRISRKFWDNALYYTLMGCAGHGVCLRDDYLENIHIYEETVEVIDTSPINIDLHQHYFDLADKYLPIPQPEWEVIDFGGEVVEDRFASEEAAYSYARNLGHDDQGNEYTVREAEPRE